MLCRLRDATRCMANCLQFVLGGFRDIQCVWPCSIHCFNASILVSVQSSIQCIHCDTMRALSMRCGGPIYSMRCFFCFNASFTIKTSQFFNSLFNCQSNSFFAGSGMQPKMHGLSSFNLRPHCIDFNCSIQCITQCISVLNSSSFNCQFKSFFVGSGTHEMHDLHHSMRRCSMRQLSIQCTMHHAQTS